MPKRKRKSVLLIDDDQAYCKRLKEEARNFGCKIIYVHSLEEGINEIENNSKIRAVILDGHCLINENQDPESIKSNFVSHAIRELTEFEHIYNRYVPFCINTTDPDDFKEDMEGITLVFRKDAEHREMFRYITQEINQLQEIRIMNEFDDVFGFFETYFDPEDMELLIKLLSESFSENFPAIIVKLDILRRLEEKLFDIIFVNYLGKDPAEISTRAMSRTKNIIFRLKQQKKLPLFLFDFAMDIYSLSSRFAVHNNIENTKFKLTKYSVNSLIFAFLELCVWAEQLIENKNGTENI